MALLPPIPVLDLRDAEAPAAAACEALPREVAELVAGATHRLPALAVAAADRLSRRWTARNATPYAAEVDAVARRIGRPGAHLLNASFEWGCTTGVAPAGGRDGGGMRMVRVLDWPFEGLGRNLAALRQRGPAGEWINLGWPGFVGCITGMAPGRFAGAINQPPLPETRPGAAARARGWHLPALAADWLAERPATWRTRALPPAHLLRLAMETAPDYAAALRLLRDEPVAAPALFVLAGTAPGEGAVIERARTEARVRPAAPGVAAANHWAALPIRGAPRWRDSETRAAGLLRAMEADPLGDGLPDPVVNELTRLVAVMEPGSGRLLATGYETAGPVTARLDLDGGTAPP